ncbi:MAG: universal stress protein [Alphaproteobacteria bacterium]|nr:universal stress protein [Alphaproteobacteria bacterium]
MYRNILIATDGSELATDAARQGIALAKSLGSKVTVIKVTEPPYGYDANLPADAQPGIVQAAREEAKAILAGLADAARSAGVPCETVHVEQGPPYLSIIETAQAKSCDLIVMGSHGRSGVAAVVVGSHTMKVLTHSKIPVLVYR